MVVLGRGSFATNKTKHLTPPIANISDIGSLKRFADRDAARDMLHDVARMAAPLISEYGFKVGTLCEMYPKSPNLLGLNINHGQKIMLRLRFHSNERLFLPLDDIVETFLHELTHNIHGPHNAAFYELLDELRDRYRVLRTGVVPRNGYRSEQSRLGGAHALGNIRDQRLKKYGLRKEARKLGGVPGKWSGEELRRKRLLAIQRRLKDNEWCQESLNVDLKDTQPNTSVIVIEDDDFSSPTGDNNQEDQSAGVSSISPYQEFVDLTLNEVDEDPVIVTSCLACEKHDKKRVTFRLLPAMETPTKTLIRKSSTKASAGKTESPIYTFSSSPGKTFFGEQDKYPRRKLVALLNFEEIIQRNEKGDEETTNGRLSSHVRKKQKGKFKKQSQPKPNPKKRRDKKVVKSMSMEELIKLNP